MTILVTGSSGHLGEALMRTLRADARVALGLDVVRSAFTDVVGSIADRACVQRAIAGADAVLSPRQARARGPARLSTWP